MGDLNLRLTLLAFGMLVVIPGCADSNPQRDPWVQGAMLEPERSRNPQQSAELRNRLITGQVDR